MTPMQLYLTALPIFIVAIIFEGLFYRFHLKQSYSWKVTGVNLAVALAYLASDALSAGLITAVNLATYQVRLFSIPTNWLTVTGLVFLVDFVYYWMHRLSHEIRWLWALHSVHHSAEQISFSVSYRLGWTKLISGSWLFLVPVVWLGFEPQTVALVWVITLLYQFWLHSEFIPKLGFIEKFMNTPSHHRVHHATNPEYLDRNYSGMFIFWDKLFGSFEPEKDGVQNTYGLIHQVKSLNPVKIAFAEYICLYEDIKTAKNGREVLGYLFKPPGWRPNGQGVTSEDLRKAHLQNQTQNLAI
jgi:sterol desaturase/sphingolipid hydroxylase (fatty acid hydroxylase superfamily)